jgi:LPXTG-motif cell wall-anchored protein
MLSDALACTPKPKDLKKILNFESSNNKHYLTFNGLSGCSDNTSTYSSNLGLNRVSLTLGAVGKGYMVQEVTTFLQNKYPDLSMGYLNGGESSYSVINKPNESAMNVYVLHPDLEAVGFPVPIVNLAINGSFSVSTSADRRGDNYYEIADAERLNVVTRHHIINPLTGYSPNINRSITIVADNAFYLDALSTALLCQSPQAGQSMLKKFNGKYGRVDGLWMSDYNYQDETYNIYVSGDLVDDMSIAEYSSRVKNYYMSDSYNKFIPFDPKLGRPDITEDKGLSSQQVTAIVMIGIVLLAGLFYGILKRKKKSTINAENEPSKNKSQ